MTNLKTKTKKHLLRGKGKLYLQAQNGKQNDENRNQTISSIN